MSELTDRLYLDWRLVNGSQGLSQRERWLRDAMQLRRPGRRGPERSAGRGRSAPEKRGAN